MRTLLVIGMILGLCGPAALAQDTCAIAEPDGDGFISIFNGVDLAGWEGKPGWWYVEDGAITAESTPEKPCKKHNYLMWRGGQADGDFELKLKYKINGGNSGIQFRSRELDDWDIAGYQADIEAGTTWTGCLFEVKGRNGGVAMRGTRTTTAEDGTQTVEAIGDSAELMKLVKQDDWNEYHIKAIGNHIALSINGHVMCEAIDRNAVLSGYSAVPRAPLLPGKPVGGMIAFQMHPGPPMKVQFKDIKLKEYSKQPAPTGRLVELSDGSPTSIDPSPEFTWQMNSKKKDDAQTAYQLQVLVSGPARDAMMSPLDSDIPSGPEFIVVADGGRVESRNSVAVSSPKMGAAPARFQPDKTYYWRVRTWNSEGKMSEWSRTDSNWFYIRSDDPGQHDLPTQDPWPCPGEYSVVRPWLRDSWTWPVRTVKKGPGHYFLDFGHAAFGTLSFHNPVKWPNDVIVDRDVVVPGTPAKVEIHLGEMAGENDTVEREPGGTIRYRKMEFDPDKKTVESMRSYRHVSSHGGVLHVDPPFDHPVPITPDQRNTGGAAIKMPEDMEVMPFRYAELVNLPFELEEDDVVQLATHYQFNDADSAFSSSDQTLNELWDFCKYTMKATSFCGVFVDGDRERIPYEADAYINQLGWYAATREFTLPRFSNEYLIQHPTWPTEWQLHVPMMVWADYMHTGDTDSLVMFYDDVKAKTLYQLAREDGLISTVDGRFTPEVKEAIHIGRLRDIVDWPKGERDGYEMLPYNTVVNAFHYEALQKMAELARAAGNEADRKFFEERAGEVYQSFNEVFFDEATGLYVDGEGSNHSSLHANMMPLAFDLVPEQRKAKVARFVKSRGMACSVYAAQYLLEALYKCGQADYAHHLMTNESDRSWPHMWREVGSTIALEAWDIKYKPNLDWNHAWGAVPMNIIPRYLMGVEPLEPGFARVRVRPQPGPVEHVKMTLPTIRGPVDVRIDRTKDFSLELNLPANMTAEVWLPSGSGSRVFVDGEETAGAERRGDWFVLAGIGSGGHLFEVKKRIQKQ